MKRRENIIDIIRAFGIILVIIGHCINNYFIKSFIYLFHLPLFFILSGYLYNDKEAKYPWEFFGKKLRKFLIYYFIYGSFLVLFHNLFITMGIIGDQPKYSIANFITEIINSILMISREPFSAGMWFIPVLFVSIIIYNFITYFSQKSKNKKCFEIKRTILVVSLAVIGLYLGYRNCNIGLHYQTSLIVLPFIHIGQITKLYFKKYLNHNILISIAIIIVSILSLQYIKCNVELSMNLIENPLLFYIIASLLTYVVYVLSYYIDKYTNKISTLLSYIGKNTFQIMCLHILGFKIVDFLIIILFTKDYYLLPLFTHSYNKFYIIYIISGIFIPLIISKLIDKILLFTKKAIYFIQNHFCAMIS